MDVTVEDCLACFCSGIYSDIKSFFEALDASLNEAIVQLTVMNNLAEVQSSSHNLFDLLSPREIEVLMVLMDGLPNKAAAHRLSLSVRTIEMHRAHALQKLRMRSIAEVIRLVSVAGITLAPSKQPACAQESL